MGCPPPCQRLALTWGNFLLGDRSFVLQRSSSNPTWLGQSLAVCMICCPLLFFAQISIYAVLSTVR